MLNRQDEEFSFVVTNLSPEGRIQFDIIHAPTTRTDPDNRINAINELYPNESYIVCADQTRNQRMILKGKTARDQKGPRKKRPVTVEESEYKDARYRGLYFHLIVSPDQTNPVLKEQFQEGTFWQALPGFVRLSRIKMNKQELFDLDPDHTGEVQGKLSHKKIVATLGSIKGARRTTKETDDCTKANP
jgi:hypothetical protein